ncbi:hypothetical protein [Agarilytica rhodophyticola]|uniref:hypothetical protein n=1 Tax=Agarilytica rhodophyticola TaxID=1737490 RepID=UPI000B3470F6|nr:hypothetical protein [Agarilytica rhodophyticola]
MDPEDLEYTYVAIADKLEISTANPGNNPYWNKVKSVHDLVQFLHHQSRVKNASQSNLPKLLVASAKIH